MVFSIICFIVICFMSSIQASQKVNFTSKDYPNSRKLSLSLEEPLLPVRESHQFNLEEVNSYMHILLTKVANLINRVNEHQECLIVLSTKLPDAPKPQCIDEPLMPSPTTPEEPYNPLEK